MRKNNFPPRYIFFCTLESAPNQLIHKRRVQSELRRTKGAVEKRRSCERANLPALFLETGRGAHRKKPLRHRRSSFPYIHYTGAGAKTATYHAGAGLLFTGGFFSNVTANFISPERGKIPK